MELYFVLLSIAALGILGLILIVWARAAPSRESSYPELTDLDLIEDEDFNEEMLKPLPPETETEIEVDAEPVLSVDEFLSEPMVATHEDPALTSLGFSALDDFFDEPITAVEHVTPIAQPEKTYNYLPKKKSYPQQDFIILYLIAPTGRQFLGYELLQSLLANGLRFGEMSIFHRYLDEQNPQSVLFSVATAVEPGIFDLANIGGFSCPGLSLFMSVATNPDPQLAFDLMLEASLQLADDLEGTLCDSDRQPLSEEMLAMYREAI